MNQFFRVRIIYVMPCFPQILNICKISLYYIMLNFVHQNLSSVVYIMHNLNVKPCSLLTHENCLFFSFLFFFWKSFDIYTWYIYVIYIYSCTYTVWLGKNSLYRKTSDQILWSANCKKITVKIVNLDYLSWEILKVYKKNILVN